MEFWLYWTFIALGSALGVVILGLLWWFFDGGKQREEEMRRIERKRRLIMTKVKTLSEYEYEIDINGERFKVDLERLLAVLSTPEDER